MQRILTLFIVIVAAQTACHGQRMTLRECIETGIANNLSIENARIGIEKSRTGVSQNRTRLLPVINGVFQFTDYLKRPVNVTTGTLLGNDFPDDPVWQSIRSMQYNVTAGVKLSMPLYNQSIFAAVDVAKTIESLDFFSYEKAVEDLTVQIGKVYVLAQTSLEQKLLAKENIGRMEELCHITEALYEQGVVLEVDLNRARINLQNLSVQCDQYETLYAQQINMLRFLMDIPPETPLEVERMEKYLRLFHSNDVSAGLPELQLAEMRKELADHRIRAVRAGYLPTVSLVGYAGGLGYQERFSHFFHTKESSQNWFGNCFIGLNITIPIFDANSKRLQIKQYRYDAMQAENEVEQTNRRIEENYSSTLLQLNHNLEVFRTQSQSYRQAVEVYNVTEEQYREGVSSMTALLQDEMQLRTAQSACIQAYCQFNLARVDLLKLSGNLLQLTK